MSISYIFVVVGVPNLTAASIEHMLSDRDVQIVALISKAPNISRKRDVQDRLVERIVVERSTSFTAVYDQIRSAGWYVLSARRADRLLRERLFDRVYALRIRGFAQQFRGAELDMHFSLGSDLVTLRPFLDVLRTRTDQDGLSLKREARSSMCHEWVIPTSLHKNCAPHIILNPSTM